MSRRGVAVLVAFVLLLVAWSVWHGHRADRETRCDIASVEGRDC